MRHQIVIAPLAVEQLQFEANWYRQRAFSDEVARAWMEGFLELLNSLQFDPQRYPQARERPRFSEIVREVHYGSGRRKTHRALFVIEGEVVRILTVRHVAQDDFAPGSSE